MITLQNDNSKFEPLKGLCTQPKQQNRILPISRDPITGKPCISRAFPIHYIFYAEQESISHIFQYYCIQEIPFLNHDLPTVSFARSQFRLVFLENFFS